MTEIEFMALEKFKNRNYVIFYYIDLFNQHIGKFKIGSKVENPGSVFIRIDGRLLRAKLDKYSFKSENVLFSNKKIVAQIMDEAAVKSGNDFKSEIKKFENEMKKIFYPPIIETNYDRLCWNLLN